MILPEGEPPVSKGNPSDDLGLAYKDRCHIERPFLRRTIWRDRTISDLFRWRRYILASGREEAE